MEELIRRMHKDRPDLIGPDGEVKRLPELGGLFNPKGHDGPCGPRLDGRNPRAIEHLCARDLCVHDGPVEECCADLWRDEGVDTG